MQPNTQQDGLSSNSLTPKKSNCKETGKFNAFTQQVMQIKKTVKKNLEKQQENSAKIQMQILNKQSKKFKDEFLNHGMFYLVKSPLYDKNDPNKEIKLISDGSTNPNEHNQKLKQFFHRLNPHVELKEIVRNRRIATNSKFRSQQSSFDHHSYGLLQERISLSIEKHLNNARQRQNSCMQDFSKYQPFETKEKNKLAWKLKQDLRTSELVVKNAKYYTKIKGEDIKSKNNQFVDKTIKLKELNSELQQLDGYRRQEYIDKMCVHLDKEGYFNQLEEMSQQIKVWQVQNGISGDPNKGGGDQAKVFKLVNDKVGNQTVYGDSDDDKSE